MRRKYGIMGMVALSVVQSIWADLLVQTDRPDALYTLNSNVSFTITAPGKGSLDVVLSRDGKDILKQKTISCDEQPVTVEGTLREPGFLRCQVTYTPAEDGKPEKAMAAAGFDPEAIKPAPNHMPSDFDAFWDGKKKELAAVVMEPEMVPVQTADSAVSLFDIKVPCVGKPVSGYYTRPKRAVKGSCPAIVFFHGAGVRSASKGAVVEYAKDGFIALDINAHGLPNGKAKEYYDNLYKTELKGYKFFGKESIEECYFTGMFLRIIRALEFIKAQPEWNGEVLVAYGSSQGGAQAIAAAGLDSDVSILVARVPAMCDHGGEICGWPRLIPVEKDGSYNEQVLAVSRYIDCVNFASKAKAAAHWLVGFIDPTCRPTSVYAAYNSYAGPKEMINEPMMKHEFLSEHTVVLKDWILEQLGR